MRVLGVLAAWGVLAVLATLCFAVGGSIGYRRGVQDAVRQLRERRSGKTGCRPMPLPHHRRRPVSRIRLRSTVRPGWSVTAGSAMSARGIAARARIHLSPAAVGALAAVCLLTVPGVALGATVAQPGDTLWGVKRGMEQARLVVAVGPSRDAVIHADLAARRLTELNQLLSMGGADPQVVDTVIGNLRHHTESATDQLNQTAVADRAALAERLDGIVERQIAVIDLLLGVDCAEQADPQCVALTGTRQASVTLQRTAIAIAAGDASIDAPGGPAAATEQPSDAVAGVASSEVQSALAAPAATAEPTGEASGAGATAGPSETPTATLSTPDIGDGEGTSETADDGSSGSSDAPSDSQSSPSSPPPNIGGAESKTAETLESDVNDAADAAAEEEASDP